MSKRSGMPTQAPQPSKPPGCKRNELPRSARPSSPAQAPSSRRSIKAIPSQNSIQSNDDNNSSSNSEPATDDEANITSAFGGVNESTDYGISFQFDIAQRQAVAMLNNITKKSERNHQRYDEFRDNISVKDKRIDELHASFEDLACQTAGLERLCNSDVDAASLEKLFMAIPLQQRKLYQGE
ncbi:Choline dehydrogenase [Phytophthora cinnamomi]|uniref:Choline dehydrogenase n=1 Tax=Phytophthora cinnamomi TaxID=4785 RepID=UPI00355A0DDE|nr:Choline dehydrogenase [Phytophthora cinnamomi]